MMTAEQPPTFETDPRFPSGPWTGFFLQRGYPELERLTDSYTRLLASGGVISAQLRDAALAAHVELHRAPRSTPDLGSFVSRKAVTSMRSHLLAALGVRSIVGSSRGIARRG